MCIDVDVNSSLLESPRMVFLIPKDHSMLYLFLTTSTAIASGNWEM